MRHFKVTIAYVVYVEDDTDDNVEEIAVEHLDEFFAHDQNITIEEITDLSDVNLSLALRDGGWARDTSEEVADAIIRAKEPTIDLGPDGSIKIAAKREP